MRNITLKYNLIVDRTGYMAVFCHAEGHKPYLISTNPWCDIMLRAPFLVTSLDYPGETLFLPKNRIQIIIKLLSDE